MSERLICPYCSAWGEFDGIKLLSDTNYLPIKQAKASFLTRKEAHKAAHFFDDKDPSEYGVVDEVLFKDGEEVVITEVNLPEKRNRYEYF